MKTLKQLKTTSLQLQDDTINYIEIGELKKYLEIANKFICDDAKFVINWLIENNDTYMKQFGGDNALASFYNAGIPSDSSLKPLYTAIGKLNKTNKLLEIPVFQTQAQFDAIISKKASPDEIILDLDSDRGRNEIAKKFDALVWRVARSFNGKSSFTLDELHDIGYEGLVWAMNSYGKPSNKMNTKIDNIKQKIKTSVDADEKDSLKDELKSITDELKKYKSYTFLSFASYMIRASIMEAIKNESHLVRIPVSQQKKEREETGRNTVSNSISGDQTIGHDSEGNGRSLFSYMDDGERGGKSIDNEDIAKIWQEIYKNLEEKFDDRTIDIFYAAFGVGKYNEKVKKKELAAKYKTAQSNITALLNKVMTYIRTNKKVYGLFMDIVDLMAECQAEEEANILEDNHYISGIKLDNDD